MVDSHTAGRRTTWRVALAAAMAATLVPSPARAQVISSAGSVIQHIAGPSERLELTTNSSRILTLEKRIPRVQVNNPELLAVTPLSATQIQISAKKAGVTAVNLWDDEGNVHTVDVFIYGDVRELEHALKTQFPNSSVRVYRYSNSLVLTGFIDRPDYVSPIVELAQDYSPKVINNINVGGVQQVLLKVRVFEVSRTKLRRMGVDFAQVSSSGGFIGSRPGGLLANISNAGSGFQTVTDSGGQIIEFGIVDGGDAFFGFLDALQQHNLAKILAEPNIVAVSGRPAQFNEGGEIPIIVPQSLGTTSVEYKKFGTQVDFLPIVLGNGNVRLEVRPRISELDSSNAVTLQNIQVPALTVREVDTAVEMKAGQTFALAGLIQRRTQAVNRGVPYLSNMPVLGVPFRKTEEVVNEIELLILVTPEFVDAIEPHEVPQCFPGAGTMSPDDCELYWGGHLERPNMCNGCGPNGCVPVHGHEPCCPEGQLGVSTSTGFHDAHGAGGAMLPTYSPAPGGPMGPVYGPVTEGPMTQGTMGEPTLAPAPDSLPLPAEPLPGRGELVLPPQAEPGFAPTTGSAEPQGGPRLSRRPAAPRPAPQRNPTYLRQAPSPYTPPQPTAGSVPPEPALIGPLGYDAEE